MAFLGQESPRCPVSAALLGRLCSSLLPLPGPLSPSQFLRAPQTLHNRLPSAPHTKASLECHSLAGKARSPLFLRLPVTHSGEEGSFLQSSRASLTSEVDVFPRLGAGNTSLTGPPWHSQQAVAGTRGRPRLRVTRGQSDIESLGHRYTCPSVWHAVKVLGVGRCL